VEAQGIRSRCLQPKLPVVSPNSALVDRFTTALERGEFRLSNSGLVISYSIGSTSSRLATIPPFFPIDRYTHLGSVSCRTRSGDRVDSSTRTASGSSGAGYFGRLRASAGITFTSPRLSARILLSILLRSPITSHVAPCPRICCAAAVTSAGRIARTRSPYVAK
jgi:hypothetical protein